MRDLKEDRKILDEIDSKIIALLEKRMEIIKEVGSYKLRNNLKIEDKNREKSIIENLEKVINPEFKNIVEPIYNEIFKESKKITSKIKNENFKYGLIGKSLSHSKSKEIHELLSRYEYNLRNIDENELSSFFKDKNFKGINVTIPYKETSMKYLDEIDFSSYDIKLIAYEENAYNGELVNFKKAISNAKQGSKIAIIIGPEGGIDPKEIDKLEEKGFTCCAFGRRILRTETAPLYALSAISYELELKK